MTRRENRAAHNLVNAFAFMAACWLLFFAMVALAKIAERPQHLPRYMVSLFPSAVLLVATVNAHPPKYPVRWLVASGRDTGLALDDLLKGESEASPRICEVSPAAVLAPQNFVATKVGVSSDGQPEAADAAARSRGDQVSSGLLHRQPSRPDASTDGQLPLERVSRAHGVRRDSGTACARPVKHAREYPPVLSRDFYQGLVFALILVAPFWTMVGWAIWRWA